MMEMPATTRQCILREQVISGIVWTNSLKTRYTHWNGPMNESCTHNRKCDQPHRKLQYILLKDFYDNAYLDEVSSKNTSECRIFWGILQEMKGNELILQECRKWTNSCSKGGHSTAPPSQELRTQTQDYSIDWNQFCLVSHAETAVHSNKCW